ncbi:hypothetical protein HA402_005625 [Bradysia odoriphaga]|nr:hypothetical protein HA402_005625 [Bradysia odoriphaga]
MDMDTSRTLTKVLGKRDIDKIPPDVLKKLEKYFETNNEQFIQTKVLYNTTQKNIEKLRKEYEKLLSTTQDTTAKRDAAQSNVTELRHQLDTANAEVARLTRQVTSQESETIGYRKECNQLIDEKDQLMKVADGKDATINHLQSDLKALKAELKSAVSEKNDAITRFAEMAAKEQSMDDREKRLEKEIERLSNEVVKWTDKYTKIVTELTVANQDRTSVTTQMEMDLRRKTEELSAANYTIRQLTESTQLSSSQRDGESVQLKIKLNESVALIEHYKRELDAKIKLVDLYKANFDECQAQTNELRTEANNLNQIVKETTEKCVTLESNLKNLTDQHQVELSEMNATIEKLKGELKAGGDLLKAAETKRAEEVLEKLFPRAATSNRMLKDNASLTEMFSRYNDSVSDVHRLEVECLQLNTKLECLTMKLQETTSEFDRQQIEYRKILKQNDEMTQQVVAAVTELDSLREKLKENSQKLANAESENVQLKCTQKDLARQICNLLNKVEASGNEPTSDQLQFKRLGLSNETIRKELITFDNIVELQENNQKLMLKIRELSSRVVKLEEQNIKLQSCEQQISYLERQVNDAEAARVANEDFLAMTTKQKERFKQLYYEAMTYMGKQTLTEEEAVDNVPLSSSQSTTSHSTPDRKDKRLLDVELKLQEKVKELKVLKEEHNEYRKQSTINFDMLKQQCESVERKVSELISENSKLRSQENFASEQMKSHRNDIAIYKKQIQVLEERNQIYDKTIAKQELANKQLKEDAWNTIMQLSTAENRCGYLEMECRRLTEAKKNLEIENGALHRQKMTQSILESTCELAKISSERSDFEGRIQMEKQLEDQVRQCEVLKRKLEDEQHRFTEENESLKRQRENAIKKLSDEQAQTENLRTKLSETRDQIEAKTQQIRNLSEKLQEALTPCKSDNPIAKGNKKIKDLELQVKAKAAEIGQLKLELQECEAKIQSFDKFKSDWEDETKALKENYEAWKTTFNAELQASRLNETNLKSQVDELQQEIRLQLTSSHSKASTALSQSKIQAEYQEALQKITENNKELRELRTQCHKLKENLQVVERNYANEMLAHSSDLQDLTLRKDQLNKCQDEMYRLKSAKEEADELMRKSQLEWEETTKKLIDGRQELEHKVEMLEKQNLELVDLLQAQNSKVLPSSSDTLNESVANSSIMNRTLTDEEFKEFSYEKLFGVVKYLRREKDIATTHTEILRIENTRQLAELDLQTKRVRELEAELTSIKSAINAPDAISSITNYEDLRRTMETLNAVTDTNIHLREEKLQLDNRIRELAEKVEKLEGEMLSMQEKNRELTEKNEEKAKENNMLRSNIDKLRQKITDVAERSNKNPEDFKRLQNERENLAKMFTAEKDNLRIVNEQLNSIKTEKNRIEQDSAVRAKQLQAVSDDRKKLQDELNNFKQINVRLTVESIEIKANILKKEEELKAIQTELTSTEDQLKDSRSKEMQLRKIAKKYREAYTELKTKDDEASKTSGEPAAGPSTVRIDTESSVQELSNRLTLLQEEINELKKENESLRKQDENQIITDARNRIAALNEANRQIGRDYQVCKNQLQSCEQSRSQHDSVVAALKSQLEAKMKELLDQEAARQETIARLTRENETLNTRVNQLHRQFQQQGSKPSTSSGTNEKSPSDAARTANVKPMATPSTQSAPVNLRRGGDTPLASIRPVPVQNSRIAAVLPTSQTSNVAAVQGSSSSAGNVTALVPPQQQVHTTGNTSTAEAMSSSPTSSHTDYMPATSSAAVVVAAVPPMGSASAESTQEAESLSVNTNESSSSSSTSSQAVVQQQTVALVSPRVEVVPQNVSVPSVSQVVDQAASTSGSSSSSFITAMSSHHQASSSNTVTTSQAGHKRPRDADGDSSTGVEESSASEKNSPQNKRTRIGVQTFQGVTESGLDVEYQVPTSSQRDQEDDVVAVDSEDDDEENMDDEAVAVDENFDADNGDTDEIESFGQDDGEVIDMDEDVAPNDNNEVDVDDSSNAPNQSSSGLAASSEARGTPAEVIELSPSGQENQQIQTISSGSDAGSSSQANLWRQAQTPSRQQQQQQQNLVIQQAYDTDDSIVPSTPTLYVARRADGFSEAISSPHPTVQHGSRFTFGESGRASQLMNAVEGMDDTRVELNLLEGSGDGGQSSSSALDVQQAENVDLVANPDGANNPSNEPVAGPSSQAHGSQIPVAKKKRKTDDDATTTNVVQNVLEVEVASAEGGSDGVSSEGEKAPVAERVQVEEDREAEASVLPRNTRSRRVYQRGRGMSIDNQRSNQMIWHQADNNYGRYHQMPPHHQQQQHGNPHRGSPTRGGPLTRGGRGRPPRRPYR